MLTNAILHLHHANLHVKTQKVALDASAQQDMF